MKDVEMKMLERAKALLESGEVARVIGWKKGEFFFDPTPAVFESVEELENGFVYDWFCGANLSKYLIQISKKEGKTAVFLGILDLGYLFQGHFYVFVIPHSNRVAN